MSNQTELADLLFVTIVSRAPNRLVTPQKALSEEIRFTANSGGEERVNQASRVPEET